MTHILKYGILIVTMIAFGQTQRRPTYAGNSNHRLPAVLPQYLSEQSESTVSTSVENRIGDETSMIKTTTTTTTSPSVNSEWSGDIDWIKTWDREKQPFWYLNWKHIQEHIGAKSPPSIFAAESSKTNR